MCMVNDMIEELLVLDIVSQAGVAVVDKHLQRRGRHDAEGGEQRENLGPALHGGISTSGAIVSVGMGKERQGTEKTPRKRDGQLVARWVHLSLKKRAFEDKTATGWSVMFSALL